MMVPTLEEEPKVSLFKKCFCGGAMTGVESLSRLCSATAWCCSDFSEAGDSSWAGVTCPVIYQLGKRHS